MRWIDNIDFKMLLGEVHETAGSNTKAREIYEDILRWDATHAGAKQRLALVKTMTGGDKKSVLEKYMPSLFGKK